MVRKPGSLNPQQSLGGVVLTVRHSTSSELADFGSDGSADSVGLEGPPALWWPVLSSVVPACSAGRNFQKAAAT